MIPLRPHREEGAPPAPRGIGAIAREPLSQQLADRLITAIAVGEFTPGDRFPAERDLADRLGVSRVTVRRALKIVAERGLVTSRRGQGGGTFISDPAGAQIGKIAQSTLEDELPRLKELCEFRCLIEGTIARTAAERRDRDDIDLLNRRLREFSQSTDLSSARDADRRLHHQIALTSRNPRLIALSEQLSVEATLGFDAEPYPAQFLRRSTDEHVALVARIVEGDADGAFRSARAHYMLTYEIMQEYLTSVVHGQATAGTHTPR